MNNVLLPILTTLLLGLASWTPAAPARAAAPTPVAACTADDDCDDCGPICRWLCRLVCGDSCERPTPPPACCPPACCGK